MVTIHVVSNDERGGWLVKCQTHGRIVTRATIGDAEQSALRHADRNHRVYGAKIQVPA